MIIFIDMKQLIRFAAFVGNFLPGLLFLSNSVSAQAFKRVELPPKVIQKIDSLVGHQMDDFHYPGVAVGITYKGHRLWTKGYGYADIANQRKINPDEDLFRIGSISKTVTACALGREVTQKRLALDRAIGDYYPGLPLDKMVLTLRQLGGHLAGIRHYAGLEFFSNIHYTNCIDPLETFIYDSLLFEPGTQYAYSTYGWSVIAAVMEQGLKLPFAEIIKRDVAMPLRLQDLKTDQVDSVNYRRVTFYDYRDSSLQISPQVDNSNKWAGGGYLCAADDLARFGFSLVNKGYLSKAVLKTLTTPQLLKDGKSTDYGIGFRSSQDDFGRNWIGHSGGSIGGTSMLQIYPDEDLVVVTLINRTSADMNGLAAKIAHVLFEAGVVK
ncbi:MAG TPA: serine hydrolase domain-containing protein [Saprospiraceae bacterium]|nr:serine hydrolase domain-containing protein [Saprospiraceae bacterium]